MRPIAAIPTRRDRVKEWGQSVVNDRIGRRYRRKPRMPRSYSPGLTRAITGPNTVRAIVELRPVIKKIKEQLRARGQGKGPVSGGEESPPARAPEQKNDWLSTYPEVK